MKKTILGVLTFLLLALSSNAQVASRIIVTQAFPTDSSTVETFMYPDNRVTPINQMNRWRVGWIDSIKFKSATITRALGYTPVSTTGSYSNPSWLSSLAYSKITGAPIIPTNTNQLVNGAGFITSYTETDPIWSAASVNYRTKAQNDLLYQPIGSYLTTESDPLFDTKFASKSTTGLAEGSNLYFTTTRARNSISAGAGISYDSSTGIISNTGAVTPTFNAGAGISITGTYPNLTISTVSPTFNTNPVRAVNTNFTVSTTRYSFVSYPLTCTVTNPLLVGSSTADIFLEYSTNGGTSWTSIGRNGNSSAVGLTVSLQLTNGQTGNVFGFIPANALVRIRTVTSGTATVAIGATGQSEVIF